MNALDSLKTMTKVVADTGDIDSIRAFAPEDVTTNPSLLLKAAQIDEYKDLVDRAIDQAMRVDEQDAVAIAGDYLAVGFGKALTEIVPGRVSTEVDANLSFDRTATIAKARYLIGLYEAEGVDRDRILIKIAATWEGISAAEQLEKEGINCNLTLLFSKAQAIACADAKVFLISPFVGRILDWYKANEGRDYEAHEDPGVLSVTDIYNYYKKFDYETVVMGASFRNTGEIIELAGCDRLTISPGLLDELADMNVELERKLSPDHAESSDQEKISLNEAQFRWQMSQDAMATEKLHQGIRSFHADGEKLRALLAERMS